MKSTIPLPFWIFWASSAWVALFLACFPQLVSIDRDDLQGILQEVAPSQAVPVREPLRESSFHFASGPREILRATEEASFDAFLP